MIAIDFIAAYTVPAIIGAILYLAIGVFTQQILNAFIRNYEQKEEIVSVAIIDYLASKENNISKMIKILWPMAIFVAMGFHIGNEYYKIKTKNNYENRVGAWFL